MCIPAIAIPLSISVHDIIFLLQSSNDNVIVNNICLWCIDSVDGYTPIWYVDVDAFIMLNICVFELDVDDNKYVLLLGHDVNDVDDKYT